MKYKHLVHIVKKYGNKTTYVQDNADVINIEFDGYIYRKHRLDWVLLCPKGYALDSYDFWEDQILNKKEANGDK